jgi:acetamidase/formamidase
VPGRTIEEITKIRMDYGKTFHTLTGPIYVNGAEAGDILKVTINKIVPRAYAADIMLPGLLGQFPKQFPIGQVKYVYLDTDRQVAEWVPGVNLPLQPFPGVIAVARKEPGEYGSAPPGNFGGNLDLRDMVAGTRSICRYSFRERCCGAEILTRRREMGKCMAGRSKQLSRSSI